MDQSNGFLTRFAPVVLIRINVLNRQEDADEDVNNAKTKSAGEAADISAISIEKPAGSLWRVIGSEHLATDCLSRVGSHDIQRGEHGPLGWRPGSGDSPRQSTLDEISLQTMGVLL